MIMYRYKVVKVAMPLIHMLDLETAERKIARVEADVKEAPVDVGDIVERDEWGKLYKGRHV